MPDIHARICSECKHPLNGHIFTLRSVAEKKGGKRKLQHDHMHMNCWWFKHAEPCRIPLGMELIKPEDGKTYVWAGADKGGWKLKVYDHSKAPETPVAVSSPSPVGVPGPSSKQQPAALPVAKTA